MQKNFNIPEHHPVCLLGNVQQTDQVQVEINILKSQSLIIRLIGSPEMRI